MAEDIGGEIVIEDAALASGFVQVPVGIFFDADLKDGPVRVYGALLWYAWKCGRAPEQGIMAMELGMGERTVRRHLADLEAAGYIGIEQIGLGRANRYTIRSLNADRPKLAGQGGQRRTVKAASSGRSLRVVDSEVEQQKTLSHMPRNGEALAEAFFAAVGEPKPSSKRRERTLGIIHDLTTEGFSSEAIREACRLAGERGARGPDLLPYLVGEAHSILEAQAASRTKQAQLVAVAEHGQQEAGERHREGLALVEALTAEERAELEAQARVALGFDPERHNGPASQAVVVGWIISRLRAGEA